jgi:hypothetical protein
MFKSRKMKWAGQVAWMVQMRNALKILFRKPGKKKQLGRLGRSWEDNINMDRKEAGFEVGGWIHLA